MKNNGKSSNGHEHSGEEHPYIKVPLSTVYRLSKEAKVKRLNLGKDWKSSGEGEGYLDLTPAACEPHAASVSFAEKRRFPRIPCVIPSHFKIDIPKLKVYETMGTVRNLSRGGVLIQIREPQPEDQLIEVNDIILVHFDLDFLKMKISENEFEGRIVRVELKIKTELGVKFDGLDGETSQALADLVWRFDGGTF